MVKKEVGLQMVQILKGIWNSEAQLCETRANGRYLKSGQNHHLDFELYGFQMVGAIAIAPAIVS